MKDLEIYNKLYTELKQLGFNVYDITPKTKLTFPIVIIDTIMTIPDTIVKNNNDSFDRVNVLLKIYDYQSERGRLMENMQVIQETFKNIKETKTYKWTCVLNSMSKDVIIDTTTTDILLKGTLSVDFKNKNLKSEVI